MPEGTTNYQFIIPLTKEQKAKYDQMRKRNGQTSQGCMRKLVLTYIGEQANDEHTDG